MTPFELKSALETMTLYVDSREQATENLKKRLEQTGLPWERRKLDFGDYSCKCTVNGETLDFSTKAVIERKYDLTELCTCFGKERGRFQREFERAKSVGARIYLLVENANWENIFNGKYNSKYNPSALVASLLAWQIRYDMRIIFCKDATTGKLIKNVLYREVKEFLETRREDEE